MARYESEERAAQSDHFWKAMLVAGAFSLAFWTVVFTVA